MHDFASLALPFGVAAAEVFAPAKAVVAGINEIFSLIEVSLVAFSAHADTHSPTPS